MSLSHEKFLATLDERRTQRAPSARKQGFKSFNAHIQRLSGIVL